MAQAPRAARGEPAVRGQVRPIGRRAADVDGGVARVGSPRSDRPSAADGVATEDPGPPTRPSRSALRRDTKTVAHAGDFDRPVAHPVDNASRWTGPGPRPFAKRGSGVPRTARQARRSTRTTAGGLPRG